MENNDWPFPVPRNTPVIVHRSIVERAQPILRVTHDVEDGTWQFLDKGSANSAAHVMVVSLGEVSEMDPTIDELASMPLGWWASRNSPGEPWWQSPKEASARA